MPKFDPRVDAYIGKAADFAQPILEHLRAVIHAGCPEVVETIKWSMPFFDHHGPMCSIAAFKSHCALRFWKSELVPGAARNDEAMGQFGRITSVKALPSKRELIAMVTKAAALNEGGVSAPWMERRQQARTTRAAVPLVVPADLVAALKKNRKAKVTFDTFSPSHRREYIEWIEGAKRAETRDRRLATAIEQMTEGKHHNWRYEK